jgi:hypothetical protein
MKGGKQGLRFAILRCTEIGKESMRLAIHLRDVFLTMEDFAREQSSTLELMHLEDLNLSRYPLTSLYVRQWRPTLNRNWGDMEKCVIKLEGIEGQEVASRTVYLPSNCESHDGLMATTMVAIPDGIFGRLLVVVQRRKLVLYITEEMRRFLSADVSTSSKLDSQQYQSSIFPEQQQHQRDRIVKVLGDGQHVHVAIKKRILLLRQGKYLTGVVEISYSSTLIGMWLEHVALLGDIKEKRLWSYAAGRGLKAVVKLLLDIDKAEGRFKG